MGVSIDAGVYSFSSVVRMIKNVVPQAVDVEEMLEAIVPQFGAFVSGDNFILVNNEYYKDYNPHHNFFEFINRYYGIEEDDEIYLYDFSITGGAGADDVAYDLGVELQDLQYEW